MAGSSHVPINHSLLSFNQFARYRFRLKNALWLLHTHKKIERENKSSNMINSTSMIELKFRRNGTTRPQYTIALFSRESEKENMKSTSISSCLRIDL